jgi:hypothetical protein
MPPDSSTVDRGGRVQKPREVSRDTQGGAIRAVRGRAASFLVLAVASLAACSDPATGPVGVAGGSHRAASIALSPPDHGRSGRGFPCRISRATPQGPYAYQYGTATLYFPQAALAPGGATIYYRVRYQEPGSMPVASASCVIPNTDLAIGIADRFFGAQHGVKVREGRRSDGVTTMGCVGDGQCELEAINVVVAPTPGDTSDDPCARGGCWDRDGTDGSSGGWDGYEWDGGGDSYDAGDPDSLSCPSNLQKVVTALINVAGTNHQFDFEGPLVRISTATSPARYAINPTISKDGQWAATEGWIKVTCVGAYTPSIGGARLWLGSATYAGESDLHLVYGPQHPSF